MKNLNDARTALRLASQLKSWIEIKNSLASSGKDTIELFANSIGFSMPIPYQQTMDYANKMIADYRQQIIDLGFDPDDLSKISNYY